MKTKGSDYRTRIRTPEEGKGGTGTDARKTRRVEAILETGY
jgi:hypothetical protein